MKKRSEVDVKETWKIEDLFKDDEDFLKNLEELKNLSDNFSKNYKTLNSSEEVYKALEDFDKINGLTDRLGTFAGISMETDTTDANMAKRYAHFTKEMSKIDGELSFFHSLLAKLDKNLLEEVKKAHPEYTYYLDRIIKESKYLLTDEGEKILANLAPTFDAPYKNYNDMRYGDMEFEDFEYEGEKINLNHNTFEEFLEASAR